MGIGERRNSRGVALTTDITDEFDERGIKLFLLK